MDVMLRNKTYYENQLLSVPPELLQDDFAHTYALQVGGLLGDKDREEKREKKNPRPFTRPLTHTTKPPQSSPLEYGPIALCMDENTPPTHIYIYNHKTRQSSPLEYGPIELCMDVEPQDPATLQRPVTPDWADVQV